MQALKYIINYEENKRKMKDQNGIYKVKIQMIMKKILN